MLPRCRHVLIAMTGGLLSSLSSVSISTQMIGRDMLRPILCALLISSTVAFPFGRISFRQMTTSTGIQPRGSSPSDDNAETTASVVKNFRQAASLPGIYRCASTDGLAALFEDLDGTIQCINNSPEDTLLNRAGLILDLEDLDGTIQCINNSPEDILLNRAGLILDLRSPSERDEASASRWMERAPNGGFVAEEFDRGSSSSGSSQEKRRVLRIDVLSPSRLFDHLTNKWMSPSQKALSAMYYALDGNKLHELRMDVLNEKGLAGLYEAIISTSGEELRAGLIAITEYLEACGIFDGACAVHCVQGKDRTGLLIMLCQSMIGLSDEEIIADYHLSDALRKRDEGSAAADQFGGKVKKKGKLDRSLFSGAPKEAMIETLTWIRAQYGSINPGYLDGIGFDRQWRDRFVKAVTKKRSASGDGVPISKL